VERHTCDGLADSCTCLRGTTHPRPKCHEESEPGEEEYTPISVDRIEYWNAPRFLIQWIHLWRLPEYRNGEHYTGIAGRNAIQNDVRMDEEAASALNNKRILGISSLHVHHRYKVFGYRPPSDITVHLRGVHDKSATRSTTESGPACLIWSKAGQVVGQI
jgi:hypothetical protein